MRTLLRSVLLLGVLTVAACAGRDEAISAARDLGYTNIHIVDTSVFFNSCNGEDDTEYELAAKDQLEHDVRLLACCHFNCSIKMKR